MIGKRLMEGDTIGIVAPASIENAESINEGIEKLKGLGFNIRIGRHVYDKWGHFAGKDKDRAEDIMEMFEDYEVDMVLCVRGGYGAMRLFPYLNFHKIKKHPKIFMGYSDITVLLNSLYERLGLITFHGPMLTSNLENEHTFKSIISTLMEGYREYEIKNPADIPMISNTDISAEGEIAGGNLSLICGTLGTPYEINTNNKILFIEDVGEAPYKIDRMLTQLSLANKLQECSGIILGQFTNCEDEYKEYAFTLSEVLEDRIMSLKKPVLMNFMCGHGNPKLVLPIGAKAKLDCKSLNIKILGPVVE